MATTLDARQTAERLPWPALVDEIEALLQDLSVRVPERIVMPTAHGAVLFVMPGCDARVAMTKLISFTPANVGSATPTIQGDVTVFDPDRVWIRRRKVPPLRPGASAEVSTISGHG